MVLILRVGVLCRSLSVLLWVFAWVYVLVFLGGFWYVLKFVVLSFLQWQFASSVGECGKCVESILTCFVCMLPCE